MHLGKYFCTYKKYLTPSQILKPPHLPDDAPGPGSAVLVAEPPVGAAGHHGAREAAQQLRRGLASAGSHRGAGVIRPAVSEEENDNNVLVLRCALNSSLTPPPLPGEGVVCVVAVVMVATRAEDHSRHLPEHR